MGIAKLVVARLRRDERGFTLIELITVLGMLLIVVTALSGVLISATNIEADMNRRFSSQINARIALDQLRREIHCASAVTPIAPAVSVAQGVTVVLGSRCPSATGGATVSWCTSGSATRWALYRQVGLLRRLHAREGGRRRSLLRPRGERRPRDDRGSSGWRRGL